MTDLARIGVEVDTRQVRDATKDLDKLGASAVKVDSSVSALGRAERQTATATGTLARETQDASSRMQSMATSAAGSARALGAVGAAATAAAYAAYQVAKSLTEAALSASKLQQTYAFAFDGIASGAKQLQYVRDVSQSLGLNLSVASTEYGKLAAASIGTRLEGEKTQKIFEAVSKASIVMGLSADDAGGVMRAIGQMMSKGTVQSEELRGQLGERLPGAFQMAARAMGTTTAGLGKMLETGKVLSDDFLPKFADEILRTLKDAPERASEALQANLNRMTSSWEKFKQAIAGGAESISGLFSSVAGTLDAVSTQIERLSKSSDGMISRMFDGVGVAQLALLEKMFGVDLGVSKGVTRSSDWVEKQLTEVERLKSGVADEERQIAVNGGLSATGANARGVAEAQMRLSTLRNDLSVAQQELSYALQANQKAASASLLKWKNDPSRAGSLRDAAEGTLSSAQSGRDAARSNFNTFTSGATAKQLKDMDELTARMTAALGAARGAGEVTQVLKAFSVERDKILKPPKASTDKAEDPYLKVQESAAKYVAGLKEQQSEIGATKEQIIEMDAARVAMTLKTPKEQAAVIETARSLALATAEYARQVDEISKVEDAIADYDKTLKHNEKTVNDRVRALDRETAEMRMSDEALRAHLVTLDLEKLGIKAVDTGYEEYRKKLSDAYATNEAARQHKTMWDTIEKTAHDTWTSVWTGGKSAFEKIGATIKSAVLDLLYQMTVKEWIIGVGLTASAGTASASGSSAGGLSNLFSTGQSVYSALSGGATSGLASMIGSAGSLFGSEALTSFAAGMKGATLGAGLAGPTTAGATGALGAGGAFATALPWIGGALALASILPKAFGMGPKQSGQTSLVGSLGNQGFSGSYETPWTQAGGWFRSDKSGTDMNPVSGAMMSAFSDSVALSAQGFRQLIDAAGDSVRSFDSWSMSINRQVENQEQFNALLLDAAESIGLHLVPELKAFQLQGEALTTTATRMRDILRITDGVMKVLGRDTSTAWGKIGVSSLDARSELVNLAGGVDKLKSSTTTYYDLFFSDSEKLQKDITAMQGLFASFGQTMPGTKDAFRAMIESIDPSTPTGRATLAGLLNIAPEFAKVADATAAETAKLRDDTAKKLLDTFTAKGELTGKLTAVGDAAEYLRSASATAATATGGLTGTLGGAATAAATATTATGNLSGGLAGTASAATLATSATGGLTGTLGGAATAAATATTATGNLSGGLNTVGSAASAANDKLFTVSTKLGGTADDVLTFSSESAESTSKLTEVSGNLTKEIDNLKKTYDVAVLDIAGLGTALEKVNVETYLTVLTGVFDSFAKRLEQVRDGIKSERIAVREAAIQIIGAPARSLGALRAGANTGLPSLASGDSVRSAVASYQEAKDFLANFVADTQLSKDNPDTTRRLKSEVESAFESVRAAQNTYTAAMQAYTVAAGNSVTRLSRLREETVKYYEAQKQLADLMKSSATTLRATISDYEFSQLATDQLRAASLQGQLGASYGAAMQAALPGGDLNAMVQAATTFNGLLSKYLSLDLTDSSKATYLGWAADIATWLEKNQPRNYQSESLGILSDIDSQLAELDEGAAAASKIIAAAVLASGDRTADGLRAVIAAITGQPVPSFASGGIHTGGLRLVGENGPELEMTGPSRIFNAGQTRDILGGRNDGSVDELRALRRDIAGLRAEAQATASNTNRMKRYFERWDRGDGLAVVTDDAAPLDVRLVA